jgi:hypothetical protein
MDLIIIILKRGYAVHEIGEMKSSTMVGRQSAASQSPP